jgi:gluconolactonase
MATSPSWLKVHDEAVLVILGNTPKLDLLIEDKERPFAHEAGVFIPEQNCLFITSNQYPHPVTGKAHIHVSRIHLPSDTNSTNAQTVEIDAKNVEMANGGVNYKDGVLFCSQGTLDAPGGIAFMPLGHNANSTGYEAKVLVTSFHGRPFNSPNDVVVHSDGSIWFTDPIYGSEQGIRPPPQLPNQVYRFDPATGGIRAIACGFGRPNGICFSPGENIVYITDTEWIHGDGGTDDTRASHMYVSPLFPTRQHADGLPLDLPST